MDAASIVTQGAAAAGFAKILVDVVKVSPLPSPAMVLPELIYLTNHGRACFFGVGNWSVHFGDDLSGYADFEFR